MTDPSPTTSPGPPPPPPPSPPSASCSPWPPSPAVHPAASPSEDEARRLLRRYPLPRDMSYSYGTAGFRYDASLLPAAMVRVGMFAAVRSASLGGEEVGIMITASHNPVRDNGVKLADPDGGMLSSDWEGLAVDLANSDDPDVALGYVRKLCRDFAWMGPFDPPGGGSGGGSASASASARRMVVHVGRDTRPSSPSLSALAVRAARSLGAAVIDHGAVTTPQLHHAVMHANPHRLPNAMCRRCDEGGYLETLVGGYAELVRTEPDNGGGGGGGARTGSGRRTLVVDCACGVGAPKVELIRSCLSRLRPAGPRGGGFVALEVANRPGDGPLNGGCGAEHVQKRRLRPALYGEERSGARIEYGASLDGDADRVVFHYDRPGSGNGNGNGNGGGRRRGEFRLLDGDKIAALVAAFVREEIGHLQSRGIGVDVKSGVVQTAYANGASTSYLRSECGEEAVAIAKTGVKYVHAAAHELFDVGVYFEANGHGTVLFGPKYYSMLADAERALRGRTGRGDRANVAWRRLRALPGLVNQAVGDALSDLLLVDAVLYLRGWTIADWDGIYEDMPSRQCKVKVQDRSIITTNDNETRALSPAALQRALDAAMASASRASGSSTSTSSTSTSPSPPPRCFVRPSGTEDAVRVYAEAGTRSDADALADEAAAIVHRLCGGTGEIPTTAKARL